MNTILLVILIIVLLNFIFGTWLDWLNDSHRTKPVPEILSDIYEPEKYQKSINYGRTNFRFGLLTSSFSLVVILLMLLFGGFAFLSDKVLAQTDKFIPATLIFFGIIFILNDLISLPFSIYDTFVIEKKYGFNKMTVKTFILDKIKGWLLAIIIGGGLLSLVLYIYQATGSLFWIWAWILITAFSIFMAMFYANLIVPLFNKQVPLEEGELRDAISEFAVKAGFKLNNIFVINGSKRSTKANAYFTGLGPRKRIVLYDTLIEQMSVNEIVAVLAHEIGHYKHKHVYKSIVLSIVHTGILLYLFSLFAESKLLSNALLTSPLGYQSTHSGETYFYLNMIVFTVLYTPISMVLEIFMNMFSRKNEYEADQFAKENGMADELIGGLKKLSSNNLSNLTPHPTYVFIHYSHPSLFQRISKLNNPKSKFQIKNLTSKI